MYPILEKRLLAEGIWLMKVLAPRVARSAQPGQFVIVRVDEHGERIPLTISDFDAADGATSSWRAAWARPRSTRRSNGSGNTA